MRRRRWSDAQCAAEGQVALEFSLGTGATSVIRL